jgi:steroid delta-isomerase-like uncharacterized protein
MTTNEVVKLNKDVVDSWNQHDTNKFLSLCDERVIWRDTGAPQPFTGKDGARKFFEMWNTAFPDFRINIINTISNENRIAVEVEFTGTHTGPMRMEGAPEIPATNRKVTGNRGSYFATFKNGKVAEVHTYPDLAGMMVQLGLTQETQATI